MSRILTKLRTQAGETISETLVALLVAALALTMLAGAITASAHIITMSRNTLSGYYSANEEANGVVKLSGSGTSGKTVKLDSDDLTTQSISIEYYQNTVFEKTPVIAYKYAAPAGG